MTHMIRMTREDGLNTLSIHFYFHSNSIKYIFGLLYTVYIKHVKHAAATNFFAARG